MSRAAPVCVAVVHYHFRRGGVTRVVENAWSALDEDSYRIVLLSGEAPGRQRGASGMVREVPGLGYDDAGPACGADELADRLVAEARAALGRGPDLWHVHNHSLGKNAALPAALSLLAQRGHRLLLQIHDFAEDGRPLNYAHLRAHMEGPPGSGLAQHLYPAASHIHYSAINGRDLTYLKRAGVDEDHAHFLPNAVSMDSPSTTHPKASGDRPLVLYPTRAIRRKNIGEFLLWASLAAGGEHFAVTLAPRNPVARPVYEDWVRFSRELALDVSFEYGPASGLAFPDLLGSAHAVMTTSVAEGFGLAFLEPWLLRRPLLGRDLREITRDFTDAGVDLSALYERLDVPASWIGIDKLRSELSRSIEASFHSYGRTPPPGAIEQALHAAVTGERVDFGRLNEPMQQTVIRKIHDDNTARSEMSPAGCIEPIPSDRVVEQNARVIAREFSLARYGENLKRVYESVAASDPGPVGHLDAAGLLDVFLNPNRFNLLRT